MSSPECVTASDSKVPDTPCVFPFTHEGVLYEGCPTDPVNKTRRWCLTKTDENGRYQMPQCTKVDNFSERSLDILESQNLRGIRKF